MANSRYEKEFKELEQLTEQKFTFDYDNYIVVRVDGDKFHRFSSEHNFHKPNDKRALDLMIESAKQVINAYKGHIPLAYGHSDEFSFLIKSTSRMLSRRSSKINSMLAAVFATAYNTEWDKFLDTPRRYNAWFDAKSFPYPTYQKTINYFRWRQVDCHVNNLYNTSLHAMTGRYMRHELIPGGEIKKTSIREWVCDKSKFFSSPEATNRLSGTNSSDKNNILFEQYAINYNDELEQFKKGTVLVDTQIDYNGKNADVDSIKQYHVNLIENPIPQGKERVKTFWDEHKYIFEDYIE